MYVYIMQRHYFHLKARDAEKLPRRAFLKVELVLIFLLSKHASLLCETDRRRSVGSFLCFTAIL